MNPPQNIENVYSGECGGVYYQVAWEPEPNKSIFGWYAVNSKKLDPAEINSFLDKNKDMGFVSDVDLVSCSSSEPTTTAVFRISLLTLKAGSPEHNFVKMVMSEEGKVLLKID